MTTKQACQNLVIDWERETCEHCGEYVGHLFTHDPTPEKVLSTAPTGDRFGAIGFSVGGLLRFDTNGKGYYMDATYDCPGPWYMTKQS